VDKIKELSLTEAGLQKFLSNQKGSDNLQKISSATGKLGLISFHLFIYLFI